MEFIGSRKVTEVDWKAESEDILFALQETFGAEMPALFQENMKTLAENYAKEQPEDVLKALGQEITLTQYFLYIIEEDSDSYVLTLVREEEAGGFEQEMKDLKRKVKKQLQPRKKPGSAAKRIDLGKRLPYQVYDMPGDFRFDTQAPIDGLYLVNNLSFGVQNIESGLLSLDPEPHLVYRIPKYIEHLTGENGRYGTIWKNPEKGEDNGLKDKASYIAVGKDLSNITEWEVIHRDESCIWEVCYLYGEDLFLAGRNKAAVVKNVLSSNRRLKILLESKENELTFPKLFQVKECLYLYMQRKFYRWQSGGFLKKEGFKSVVYEVKTQTIGKIVPVNDENVAFIERNHSIPRSSEVRMTSITILNPETGTVKKIPCPVGNLASVEENCILVLCSGHDMLKNKKDLPILLSIDLKTGERLELPFGSMGTSELVNVYRSPEGRMVLRTYEHNRVYYPENLEGFMRGEKPGAQAADSTSQAINRQDKVTNAPDKNGNASKETSGKTTKKTAKRKTLPKDIDERIQNNNTEELKAVFEKCDINAYGGYSKGNMLSFHISSELMEWLTEQGIDIEMEDQFGKTPLNSHAGGWRDDEQLLSLIRLGANVNTKDRMGRTPLHFAAETGNFVKVKALAEAGADLNAADVMGITPLQGAVMRMGVHNMKYVAEVAEYLLSKGAPLDEKLQKEMTACGERIEFHRSNMSEEVQEEIAQPLAKLYRLLKVEPVPARVLYDGKSPITVREKTWQKQHDELWKMLVPGSGSASTLQGEIIRLSGRLSHEILDNGSINWNSEYRQMTDDLKEYLTGGNTLSEEERAEIQEMFAHIRKGNGDEKVLARVAELSVAWVLKNPEPVPFRKKEV